MTELSTNKKHAIIEEFFRKCSFLYGKKNPYNFNKKSIPHHISDFEMYKLEWVILLSDLEECLLCDFEKIKIFVDTFHLNHIYSQNPPSFYELYNCIRSY